MVNIAVLGYGTVGSGVVEILLNNKENIKKRAGNKEINVKYIFARRDFPDSPIADRVVKDYEVILNDPEIDIIIESMGGIEPARSYTQQALEKGISVCTPNKELVAANGPELLAVAKKNHANYLFEASVAGGIPIIRPINHSLTGDEIEEITGILNGTTNYIMTKMTNEGSDFDTVLKEAQELGYAERDPSDDIKGTDACRKIAILSSLAFEKNVDYKDIYTEGITEVTGVDIKYAKKYGGHIKLLATSERVGEEVQAMVAPMIVMPDNPLYGVNDVFNAIFVNGKYTGDLMFYGSGAGKFPTGSAVVSDVVDCAKHLGTNIMTIWDSENLNLGDIKQIKHKFLVRVSSNDLEESKSQVSSIFGKVKDIDAGIKDEYAFVTEAISEAEYEEKAEKLGNVIGKIRIKA